MKNHLERAYHVSVLTLAAFAWIIAAIIAPTTVILLFLAGLAPYLAYRLMVRGRDQ